MERKDKSQLVFEIFFGNLLIWESAIIALFTLCMYITNKITELQFTATIVNCGALCIIGIILNVIFAASQVLEKKKKRKTSRRAG